MDARPRPTSKFQRSRSRSHSPLLAKSSEESRQRLARHEGAQRSLQPAWMSRGIGVNKEILGETRGDLVKPGLTQADLDELERKVRQRNNSPDRLGEFFDSRPDSEAQQQSSKADPLDDFFESRPDSKAQQQSSKADPLDDFFDSRHDSNVQQQRSTADPLDDFFDSRHDPKVQQQRSKADPLDSFYDSRHDPKVQQQRSRADPLDDFFDSRNNPEVQQRGRSPDALGEFFESRRDSPDQKYRREHESQYDPPGPSRQSAYESWQDWRDTSHQRADDFNKCDWQNDWRSQPSRSTDNFLEVLLDLVRHALSQGGFIQGHRLGELLNKHHRDSCIQAKEKFGAKGWIATMLLESTKDIKVAQLSEHGGPCFYIDSQGNGEVPSYQAPVIIAGDRIPVKGNAKIIREQRDRKNKARGSHESPDPSPEVSRRRVHTPEPERFIEPTVRKTQDGDNRRVRTPEPERCVRPVRPSRKADYTSEPRRPVEPSGSPPRTRYQEEELAPRAKSVWDLL